MHIRFNYKPAPGTCAMLYVWPLDNPHLCVKYWHNSGPYNLYYFPQQRSYEGDSYIDFKSMVPFDEWKKILDASGYTTSRKYSMLFHNCSNGAEVALQAAGIRLFDKPSCILTPDEVYLAAKKYKISQLQHSKAEECYRFTELRIKFWVNFSGASKNEKKLASIIVSELEKRHQKYPEHTEAQIDVLMQTYRLLTSIPSIEDISKYLKSSYQFYQRHRTQIGKMKYCLERLGILSAGLFVAFLGELSTLLIQGESNFSMSTSATMLLGSGLTLFTVRYAIPEMRKSQCFETKDNDLTVSMAKLADLRTSRV